MDHKGRYESVDSFFVIPSIRETYQTFFEANSNFESSESAETNVDLESSPVYNEEIPLFNDSVLGKRTFPFSIPENCNPFPSSPFEAASFHHVESNQVDEMTRINEFE